jgi:hypothetical protein
LGVLADAAMVLGNLGIDEPRNFLSAVNVPSSLARIRRE